MTQSYVAGAAGATTLTSGLTSAATSFAVVSVTGWPTSVPFVIAIDRGTASEEKILVTARTGTVITTCTRGYDGTSPTSHSVGTNNVEHVISAVQVQELIDFANITGVSTNTVQTISAAKTLISANTGTSPLILQGAVGQTAPPLLVQNSALGTLMSLSAAALLTVTGGVDVTGGPTGAYSGELRFPSTGSGISFAICDLGTGASDLYFDHRGSASTGGWLWRNNGAATQRMTLSGAGLLTVTGGVDVSGGTNFVSGELRIGDTGASRSLGITTQSTGTPDLYFDHRGTGNTGRFFWRNGTGGVTTLMSLSGAGLLTVIGGISAIGTVSGFGTGANGAVGVYAQLFEDGTSAFLVGAGTPANIPIVVRSKGTSEVIFQGGGTTFLKGSVNAGVTFLGFHGTAAQPKPTITGARGGNAALASLLTQLAATGLLLDSTTA